jgi:WD40 repeat protein
LSVQERDGYVLVGLSDCSIAIVDLTREVILYTYKGHEDLVRGAICLMEKGLLITAGWDHSVRVWLLQVIVTSGSVATTSIPTSSGCAPCTTTMRILTLSFRRVIRAGARLGTIRRRQCRATRRSRASSGLSLDLTQNASRRMSP